MSLTQAQLAAMPRVTPTEIAEATYDATTARRRRSLVNGWPHPTSPFRKSTDVELLKLAAREAYKRDHRVAVPWTWRDQVRDMLVAEIARFYPAEDMVVLVRYRCAVAITAIHVANAHRLIDFEPGAQIYAPSADLTTGRQLSFATDGRHGWRPIPPATEPYFDALTTFEDRKWPDYMRAEGWVGEQIRKHRCPPTWGAIEEAFPAIGAWISEQRGDA